MVLVCHEDTKRTSIHALLGILGPAGPGLMLPYWGFAHCEGIVSGVAWMWGSSGAFELNIFFVLNMVGTPNDFYCETWEVSYFLDLHRFGWNPIVAEEHDLTKSAIGAFWIPVWFFWRGNGYWTNGFNKTTNYPLMDSQYPTKSLDHKLVLVGYCQPVLMGA